MRVDKHQLADYAAAVRAVPGVFNVVAVHMDTDWQLFCRQPLSRENLALIDLIGGSAPGDAMLVANTACVDVDYVTAQLFSDGVLFAETIGWRPGTPLNLSPFTTDTYAWTAWPGTWPLEQIGAQLTAMAATLHAVVQVYAQVMVDLQAAGDPCAAASAAEVIATLVGTVTLEDVIMRT